MSENLCPVCHLVLSPKQRKGRCPRCAGLGRGKRTGRIFKCGICGRDGYAQANETGKRFCSYACGNKSKEVSGPGHTSIRKDGYRQVYFPSHPDAQAGGFILEHRWVMEQIIGRRIRKGEHVHHINGVRDDNRPENLQLLDAGVHGALSNKQGAAQRKAMREELAALRIEVAEYRKRFGPLEGLPAQAEAA